MVLYNPYLRWLYQLAKYLGIRKGELPSTFITRGDLDTLTRISGFHVVRTRPSVYSPWRLFGLGDVINRVMPIIPLFKWLSFTYLVVLRPIIPSTVDGITCVIPARNERGNIDNALRRFPDLGCPTQIVFVEGHSSDGTWEEIERVALAYTHRFQIKAVQQTGKGKADAVKLGFAHANYPLLIILDADLDHAARNAGSVF